MRNFHRLVVGPPSHWPALGIQSAYAGGTTTKPTTARALPLFLLACLGTSTTVELIETTIAEFLAALPTRRRHVRAVVKLREQAT